MRHIASPSYRLFLSLFIAAFLCFPCIALAAGSTSIALSGTSVTVGNKVTVTIAGSDSSKLSLRYNNKVLKFTGCSAAGYSTEANVVSFSGKSAQVTFEAIDAGSGDLVVSSDVLSGSSASVQVAAAQSSQPEPEDSSSDEASSDDASAEDDNKKTDSSKSSSTDGDFVIDGIAYVLSERYSDNEIPDGFTKTQLKIHGGTYRELTNDKLTLVYLKPADHIEGSGVFYIYDKDSDSVSDFVILGDSNYYVIPSDTKKDIPETLIETSININDSDCTAFQYGEDESDFYYVFGTDSDGDKGWFSYDSKDKTVQRANTVFFEQAVPSGDETQEANSTKKKGSKSGFSLDSIDFDELLEGVSSSRTILAIIIFVAVVLLIILLDVLLFRRKNDYDEDDFDYDDEEESRSSGSNEPEVLQAGKLLEADDFEEANKPHRSKKFFNREKSSDIWDTADRRLSDTGDMPLANDESGKLKKQVFKGRSSDSSMDGDDNKIDLIDLNDL